MEKTRFAQTALRLALAAAASAALVAPSQAALVQGDWDPPYGAPFPDLGWRGTATIEVPLACLALSGTVVNDGSLCPLMTPVIALVEFFDLADPIPTAETLDFGGSVAVDRIFVSSGAVTAFALDSTALVISTSPLAVTSPAPGEQARFGLSIDFEDGLTVAVLRWETNPAAGGGQNDSAFPAHVRITQLTGPSPVSVPATLALAVAGLALLGATRRRR